MQSTQSETREPASPGAADAPSTKRRLATQHVREARDRLTSTSGTRPVFDYELLRQFAQNRLSGSLVILLLVLTIGLLSSAIRRRLPRWSQPLAALSVTAMGALLIWRGLIAVVPRSCHAGM